MTTTPMVDQKQIILPYKRRLSKIETIKIEHWPYKIRLLPTRTSAVQRFRYESTERRAYKSRLMLARKSARRSLSTTDQRMKLCKCHRKLKICGRILAWTHLNGNPNRRSRVVPRIKRPIQTCDSLAPLA